MKLLQKKLIIATFEISGDGASRATSELGRETLILHISESDTTYFDAVL